MNKEILRRVQLLELEILDEVDKICVNNGLTYFLIAGSLIGAVRHKGFIPWDDDLDIAMPRKDYEKFIELCKTELNERYILDARETQKNYFRLAAKVRIKNTIYMQDELKRYRGNQGIWIDILPLDETQKRNSFILRIQAMMKSLLEVSIEYKNKVDISQKPIWKKIISKIVSIFPIKLLEDLQKTIMTLGNNKDYNYFVNLASKYNYKKQTFEKKDWIPAQKILFEDKMYFAPHNYELILSSIYGDYMKIPEKDKQEIHNPILIKFEDGEEYNYEEI